MNENLEQLHNQIVFQAKENRKAEARLIDLLQRADQSRLYLHRGYSSLFRYVCDELGYSEAMTSNLITVARKATEIPELKEEIRKGNLSVSKIRKVCPVINKENKGQWIQAARKCSKKELETKVAALNTTHTPMTSVRAVAVDTVRLSVDITEDCRDKLDRLKDLLSSKTGKDCSLQEVLDFALETALDKQDPIRKAQRAEKRAIKKEEKEKEESMCPGTRKSKVQKEGVCPGTHAKPKRKALSNELVHKIQRRDRGQCSYISPDGKPCGQRRWLQFHHILAVARGGKDVLENLTTLCFSHHRLVHDDG